MVTDRLVRVRYQEMPDEILVQAWITKYGSVVICVDSGLAKGVRTDAVRRALRAIQSHTETRDGPTQVTIQADPFKPSETILASPSDFATVGSSQLRTQDS